MDHLIAPKFDDNLVCRVIKSKSRPCLMRLGVNDKCQNQFVKNVDFDQA